MKTNLPTWNLGDLYSGMDDRSIDKDLKQSLSRAKRFESRYRGKLSKLVASPNKVLAALKEYEAILEGAAKPVHFGSLLFAETSLDSKRGAFSQRMRSEYTKMNQHLIFFQLQLMDLPDKQFRSLLKDKALASYRNFFQRVAEARAHRLSEAEERLMADRNQTGRRAILRLFEEEMGAKQYEVKLGKITKKHSQTALFEYLYSPNRTARTAGFKALSQGLKDESRRLTFIFNTIYQDKAIEDRYRKYPTPEAARHLDNQIDQRTVDAMSGAVCQSYDLVQRYYRFKKKALRLKDFSVVDRMAPLAGGNKRYSWTDAKTIMLDAAKGFSPEYHAITEKFFTKRWIDARARPGKRGGAFCDFVTPGLHPYVFVNFNGSGKEVSTLAHELGHGVHAYLMRQQSYLNFDTALTVAETASVFGEMLVFEELVKGAKTKAQRFALYVSKIESIFATVYRQISMYRFEQDFHAARQKGELSTEKINSLWRRRQTELYGKAITLESDYDYWWSYIPHFLHTPFYVYAYAFGELLTLALYAEYKKSGEKFVGTYLDMLRSGSSKSPNDLVKPFGINLTQASFWKKGVELIRDMVDHAEELA